MTMPRVLDVTHVTCWDTWTDVRTIRTEVKMPAPRDPGTLLAAGPVDCAPCEGVELRLEQPVLRTVAGRVLSRQGTQ